MIVIVEESVLALYGCVTKFNFDSVAEEFKYDSTSIACSRNIFTFDLAQATDYHHIYYCCAIFKTILDSIKTLAEERTFNNIFPIIYYEMKMWNQKQLCERIRN